MIDQVYKALSSNVCRKILQILSDGKGRNVKELMKEGRFTSYPTRELDRLVALGLLLEKRRGNERIVKISDIGLELCGIMQEIQSLFSRKRELGEVTAVRGLPLSRAKVVMDIYSIIAEKGALTYEEILKEAEKKGYGKFDVDYALNKLLIYRDVLKVGDRFKVVI